MATTGNNKLTALITGASAGIGRDYARYLAARDYDLVLTARRVERLEELAVELKKAFGTKVTVLPMDLVDPDAPSQLATAIKRRRLKIDYLVNNAGYSIAGKFAKSPWQVHRDMIQVMMTAVTELCHIFAPLMAERGFGRIVNVASVAAFLPGSPGATLYSPVKAYVMRLSQSLAREYQVRGVNIIALCPGYTWSELHDVDGTRDRMNRMPKFVWLEAPRVVNDAHVAVETGKGPVIINGLLYRFLSVVFQVIPDNWMNALSRGTQSQQKEPPSPKAKPSGKKPSGKKPSGKKPASKATSKKSSSKKQGSKKLGSKKLGSKKPEPKKPEPKTPKPKT